MVLIVKPFDHEFILHVFTLVPWSTGWEEYTCEAQGTQYSYYFNRFTQETTVCIVHMGALVFASCTPKPGRVL